MTPVTAPSPPATLLVTCEGLALAALGPYGCCWNETATLDQIASRGIVMDRCIIPDTDPLALLDSLWPVLPPAAVRFVSDCESACVWAGGKGCQEIHAVPTEPPVARAQAVLETQWAALFASAARLLDAETSAAEPSSGNAGPLTWLHTEALLRCWDAPESYLPAGAWEPLEVAGEEAPEETPEEQPEDAPEPAAWFVDSLTPPDFACGADHDPDQTLAWMHTYAAQVRLLDDLIGGLAEIAFERQMRVVVLGTSGFALGEDGWLSGRRGPLSSPRIQVPLIASGAGWPCLRSPQPITPAAALQRIFSAAGALETDPLFTRVTHDPLVPAITTRGPSQYAVTTPDWCFRNTDGEEQLFVKPDDRFDVNDVARRMPGVVDQLRKSEPPVGS